MISLSKAHVKARWVNRFQSQLSHWHTLRIVFAYQGSPFGYAMEQARSFVILSR
ncbi:MAG: hypothetical protein J6U46_02010 [Bacteroidaceae bacterium]|nr:hypothetical protein [Bacteroidaceae bacterium]MBO7347214.1 hypothetical protein [Bacteroidaceae bacterium]